jgi:cell division protease FtsH
MEAQAPPPRSDASEEGQLTKPGEDRATERPWRTEGLPKRQPNRPKRRWITGAIWILGYLLLFGMLTVQDRLSGPQPIPYTEFKIQVATKNVAELFAQGDSIEGQLKKAVPVAGQPETVEFPLEQAVAVYEKLKRGQITGRAVLTP